MRLAAPLRACLVTEIVASTSTAVGVAGVRPRRVRPLFRRRKTWRGTCQRLDADAVFLVWTSNLDRKGFRDPLGDLELGGGVQNPDSADVVLVDAATTANHRQVPACFSILSSAN